MARVVRRCGCATTVKTPMYHLINEHHTPFEEHSTPGSSVSVPANACTGGEGRTKKQTLRAPRRARAEVVAATISQPSPTESPEALNDYPFWLLATLSNISVPVSRPPSPVSPVKPRRPATHMACSSQTWCHGSGSLGAHKHTQTHKLQLHGAFLW